MIRIRPDPDPDPQYCLTLLYGLFRRITHITFQVQVVFLAFIQTELNLLFLF